MFIFAVIRQNEENILPTAGVMCLVHFLLEYVHNTLGIIGGANDSNKSKWREAEGVGRAFVQKCPVEKPVSITASGSRAKTGTGERG